MSFFCEFALGENNWIALHSELKTLFIFYLIFNTGAAENKGKISAQPHIT